MKSQLLLFLAAVLLVLPASAQEEADSTYLDAFLADFNGSSDKLNQLAEAFSEEQYGWRPVEGVRSVSEVFVHVASANIMLARALGYTMEMERPSMREAEQMITAKADVIADLMMGQNHVREAVAMLKDADLSETMPMFNEEMSRYRVLMLIGGHNHEHLGQSIAYARTAGVVPPWSADG